jgi:hypothetical protein
LGGLGLLELELEALLSVPRNGAIADDINGLSSRLPIKLIRCKDASRRARRIHVGDKLRSEESLESCLDNNLGKLSLMRKDFKLATPVDAVGI